MVDQQKQKFSPPHLFITSLVLILGIFISGLLVTLTSNPVAAVNGCPGQETPGTGDNAGKCIGLDGKPTTSTPTGATQTDVQTPAGDASTQDDTVTCAIEKMGWILCPVIETAGKVGDKAFALLANNFLQTEPELVSQGSGTKTAWGLALNLANLMFIAVFIIIILSQVTGRGINNYGIKKLLPRLIIGAILVNVSYYVCQLMVDLSNILGFELKNFLVDTARSVSSSSVFPQQTSIDNQTSNGTLGLIATGILATAAIVWFLLPVLFLGVSTVVITCLVVIAILLLRKALIILLVVLSPIAFVAYLLPNTEGYFQKWLKMFWQLLMVFPIVGMLFGAGQLASAIILVAGTNSSQVQSTNSTATTTKTDSSYDDPGTKKGGKCIQLPKGSVEGRLGKCTGGSTPFMLGLVAAGVAVAPLLAVWAVLKGALSAAGAIGGKIAGAVQSAGNKGNQLGKAGEDKLKKRMGENLNRRWQNAQSRGIDENGNATSMAGRWGMRGARRNERGRLSEEELKRRQRRALDQQLAGAGAGELTGGLAGGGAEAIRAAEANRRKVVADEVSAARLSVENMNDREASDAAQQLINNREFDSPHLAALLEHLAQVDKQAFMAIATQVSGSGQNLATQTAAAAMGGMGGFYGAQNAADMRRGETAMDLTGIAVQNAANGSFSGENIAGLSNSDINIIRDITTNVGGQVGAEAQRQIGDAYKNLAPEVKNKVSAQKQQNLGSFPHS